MLLAIFYYDGIFGCYKSYPLKENLVPRFGGIGKQLRRFYYMLILKDIEILTHFLNNIHRS
jgi:hypothetical protein